MVVPKNILEFDQATELFKGVNLTVTLLPGQKGIENKVTKEWIYKHDPEKQGKISIRSGKQWMMISCLDFVNLFNNVLDTPKMSAIIDYWGKLELNELSKALGQELKYESPFKKV